MTVGRASWGFGVVIGAAVLGGCVAKGAPRPGDGAPSVADRSAGAEADPGAPSAAEALRQPARGAFARDRAAILAMAGRYEVTFQFQETVALAAAYELRKPYRERATEWIEVIEDAGDRIVLQHILVQNEKGPTERVVKHWRQVWRYQDGDLIEFKGRGRFEPRRLGAADVAGTWTQAVFQVDDSPRYESFGRWVHDANLSAWESAETWRPLPRREYTVRHDYDVLVGCNRHTITPGGWVHEQDSYKLVLGADGGTILTREVGLNRYERVERVDFSAGEEYWRRTAPFWADVRAAWDAILASGKPVTLRPGAGDDHLWKRMFGLAEDARAAATYDPSWARPRIEETLARFVQVE